MAQSVTFTQADQALCLAVITQVKGVKVDLELIQSELDLPTKSAASMRWSRFNKKLNEAAGTPATFSEADQALCLAVIKQANVTGIDYELLRTRLSLPTKSAASMRWSRFNAKLKQGAAGASINAANSPPSTPIGKTTGKAKSRNSSAKKRKINEEEDAGNQAPESPTKLARRSKGTKSAKAVVKSKEAEEEVDGFEDSGNCTEEEVSEMASLSDDEV